jgi:hypothetical protein
MDRVQGLITDAFFKNAKRFGTIQLFGVAILVLLWQFNSPVITVQEGQVALGWLILNALVSPFIPRLQPFTTPSILNPRCHYCNGQMTATQLKCLNCGAESSIPQPPARDTK